jgi:hypothetical protein
MASMPRDPCLCRSGWPGRRSCPWWLRYRRASLAQKPQGECITEHARVPNGDTWGTEGPHSLANRASRARTMIRTMPRAFARPSHGRMRGGPVQSVAHKLSRACYGIM